MKQKRIKFHDPRVLSMPKTFATIMLVGIVLAALIWFMPLSFIIGD